MDDPVTVEALAAEWSGYEETRKTIVDRQTAIKAELRERIGIAQNVPAGKLKITVRENNRFNATHAAEVLPDEWADQLWVKVIDREKAQELLPPKWYKACQTNVGEPQVIIQANNRIKV